MFCTAKGKESLGIGKLIEVKGKTVSIEYFVSPTQNNLEVEVPLSHVNKVILSPQTRVYNKDVSSGLWKIGRLLSDDDDFVYVQFPNSVRSNISKDEVFVRCDLPIEDPVSHLAKFLNETPLFADSRRKFVRNILTQRCVSKGMSALMSSSIELEPHQVSVVERILKDPIQRYLLADEVGLGKTIEAGVIIRQFVLDCPVDHLIVVVTPPNLVTQWRNELSRRFFLDYCHDESLFVVANNDRQKLKTLLPRANMLVVDEVHQVVQNLDLKKPTEIYELIRKSAHQAKRVLLLSATPVLGNESGFLAMLHLLDPIVYPLSGLKIFHEKIESRKPLAHLIADFTPDNFFFLGDSLSQITSMFPEDVLLHAYAEKLERLLEDAPVEADENILNAIDAIRVHVSETYKLHRRILRNRRSDVAGLTPERLGFKGVEYRSAERSTVVGLIDKWRSEATLSVYGAEGSSASIALANVFIGFLDALFDSPSKLIDLVNKRNHPDRHQSECDDVSIWQPPLFKNEELILERLSSAASDLQSDKSKIQALIDLISRRSGSRNKIIIFCSHPSVADDVASSLENVLSGQVLRFDPQDNDDTALEGFLNKTEYKILVCDQNSEEGLNLHGGKKVMVHYDLPISPNRIEQRLGRLDRYGSSGDILSYGLVCTDDLYESGWSRCLDKGFEVFERSIASLQYLIEEELQKFGSLLFNNGVEAFASLTDVLSGPDGLLVKELKKIELQDQLDSIHEEVDESFYDLEEYDADWECIGKEIDSWVIDCLLFEKKNYHIEEPFPPDRVFKCQYNHDSHRDTLLPLNKFMENFLPSIDFDDPQSRAKKPRTYPFSYRRETSVHKKVHLLRYGNSFINGVMDFTSCDDRGKSFALWRCAPSYDSREGVDNFFRFDFIVEVNLGPLLKVCNDAGLNSIDTTSKAFRRQGDVVFPPIYHTLWLDSEFNPPSLDLTKNYLENGYKKTPRDSNGSYDKNINPSRWEWLWKNFPMFNNWDDVCYEARSAAEKTLRENTHLDKLIQKSIREFKASDERYHSQTVGRIASLSKIEKDNEECELERYLVLRKALCDGVVKPSVKIDSVGVVLLADFMPTFEL